MWESGDAISCAIYDTPEMKAERAALRHDAGVRSALDEWWDATDVDNNGQIDRAEYLELGKALYRVMIADGDEAAAQSSAEDDWAEDSRGHAVMSGDHFRDAIFQLADLWTDGLEPETYVAFLRDLLPKMQAAGLGRGKWWGSSGAESAAPDEPPAPSAGTVIRVKLHLDARAFTGTSSSRTPPAGFGAATALAALDGGGAQGGALGDHGEGGGADASGGSGAGASGGGGEEREGAAGVRVRFDLLSLVVPDTGPDDAARKAAEAAEAARARKAAADAARLSAEAEAARRAAEEAAANVAAEEAARRQAALDSQAAAEEADHPRREAEEGLDGDGGPASPLPPPAVPPPSRSGQRERAWTAAQESAEGSDLLNSTLEPPAFPDDPPAAPAAPAEGAWPHPPMRPPTSARPSPSRGSRRTSRLSHAPSLKPSRAPSRRTSRELAEGAPADAPGTSEQGSSYENMSRVYYGELPLKRPPPTAPARTARPSRMASREYTAAELSFFVPPQEIYGPAAVPQHQPAWSGTPVWANRMGAAAVMSNKAGAGLASTCAVDVGLGGSWALTSFLVDSEERDRETRPPRQARMSYP